MTRDEFIESVKREYEFAKVKHPTFAGKLTDIPYKRALLFESQQKMVNDSDGKNATAENLLMEELYEMIVAYHNSNKCHCLQELAQCAAVIFRMFDMINEELK